MYEPVVWVRAGSPPGVAEAGAEGAVPVHEHCYSRLVDAREPGE